MRSRILTVLLLVGHYTCALLPAAQKGRGFDVVRYRRGAGSTLGGFLVFLPPEQGVLSLLAVFSFLLVPQAEEQSLRQPYG